MSKTTDPLRADFARAVQLLGGQKGAARSIPCSDRHIRLVLNGQRDLTPGILRDTAAALTRHAANCRETERTLFSATVAVAGAVIRRKGER